MGWCGVGGRAGMPGPRHPLTLCVQTCQLPLLRVLSQCGHVMSGELSPCCILASPATTSHPCPWLWGVHTPLSAAYGSPSHCRPGYNIDYFSSQIGRGTQHRKR